MHMTYDMYKHIRDATIYWHYCDTLGSDTGHLGLIDISNTMIYQCIDIKLYIFTALQLRKVSKIS